MNMQVIRPLLLAAGLGCAGGALAAGATLEVQPAAAAAGARSAPATIEVLSWSWGTSNPGLAAGSGGAGKVNVQDLSVMKHSGAARQAPAVVSPRDAASGLPTGKRSAAAGPAVAAGDVDGDGMSDAVAPADGSIAVAVLQLGPSSRLVTDCVKGTHFPTAVLTASGKRYRFSDATFTCDAGSAAAGSRDPLKGMLKGHVTLIK